MRALDIPEINPVLEAILISGALIRLQSLGGTLLLAKGDDAALIGAVDASCGLGWPGTLLAMATQLIKPAMAGPMDHIEKGFHSFKLYGKRMLAALDIRGATVAQPLLDAAAVIRDGTDIGEQAGGRASRWQCWSAQRTVNPRRPRDHRRARHLPFAESGGRLLFHLISKLSRYTTHSIMPPLFGLESDRSGQVRCQA